MFDPNYKKRQMGTGFTNIGNILRANVGAGQQMAGRIAQGVQTAGQAAQQQLGQAQQKFKTGYGEATTPLIGATGSLTQAGGMAKQPGESDDDYAKRIAGAGVNYAEIGKKISGAAYTGPKGLENTQGLLSSAVTAGQMGGLAGTAAGQQQLAKQFVAGTQPYTRGESALDQLLIGRSLEGQRQLQQAREAVSGIPQDVLAASKSAGLQAAGIQKGIEQEKAKVLGGIQSGIGEIQQRAQEAGQAYSKDAARIAELLSGADESKIGKVMTDTGTQFSPEQAEYDKRLLSNLSKYGIDTKALSGQGLSKDEMTKLMQEIATKATTGFAQRYTEPQKAALAKLAEFQQDPTKAAQIAQQKDKSAFQLSGEDIKNLATFGTAKETQKTEKEKIELAKRYKAVADEFKSYKDTINKAPPGFRAQFENQFFDAIAKKYGFDPNELANLAPDKGRVLAALYGLYEKNRNPYLESQKERKASKEFSLQDYINKTYGL